jgi:broad specificity phosphatase PhoE
MIDDNEFYLHLIRHGQSEFNVTPDRMGQFSDTPLTEKGQQQAWLLNARFKKEEQKFDKVFASDYIRAHDTAKIVVCGSYSDIILNPSLREYSAGDWNGQSRKEKISTEVKLRMGLLANGFLPPNGESMHMVERRASQWLEDAILYNTDIIKESAIRKNKGQAPQEIAVFSHGMTIKCLLHYVMGFDQSFTWKLTLDNTSISKLYFGKDGWRLLSINDCAHLKG